MHVCHSLHATTQSEADNSCQTASPFNIVTEEHLGECLNDLYRIVTDQNILEIHHHGTHVNVGLTKETHGSRQALMWENFRV